MCGIVGYYSDKGPIPRAKLERACDMLEHRGPDARGVYIDDRVGLAHRRLSILDLSSAANQPMVELGGDVVLVYNGEIYNYRELRQKLAGRGHRFRTSSDTEVVLRMYLEYGAECVKQFQGMFAFAVWDKRDKLLFLARDRLGIKPVYYQVKGGIFAFASEIKAILVFDSTSPRIHPQALHDYLTFRYTIAPDTMFRDVKKLPPAHRLTFSDGRLNVDRYWSPDYKKRIVAKEKDWISELKNCVLATVNSHLVSDVPVGVLLSGGLDSSIIAAATQAEGRRPVKTFSVAFEDGGVYDERPFARRVANELSTEHFDVVVTARDFIDTLSAYVWHMDEPVADPASIPLYHVARLARGYVKVVLSGEGSDELFGGYINDRQFKGYNRLKYFKRLPKWLRNNVLESLNRTLLRSSKLDMYLQNSGSPLSAYGRLMPVFQDNVFSEAEKTRLYDGYWASVAPLEESVDKMRRAFQTVESFEFLDQILCVSLLYWLPDDLLTKADKMTMANSLELRVPFLDHVLVDFVGGMPTSLKVRQQGRRCVVKYGLKKAFADMLPSEIIQRQKLGFAVPYARWFRKEMREIVSDTLLSKRSTEDGWFDRRELERLLALAMRPSEVSQDVVWDPDAKKVWSLFVFELWRERFRPDHV